MLGAPIWRQWPFHALELVGLFLRIDLLFSGATYIALGSNVARLPV